MSDLRNRIIELKLGGTPSAPTELKELLGSFTSHVSMAKETMIINKAKSMVESAKKELAAKDDSINAKIV